MENIPSLNENSLGSFNRVPAESNFFNKKTTFFIFGLILFTMLFYLFFFSAPKSFPTGTVINIKEGVSLRATSKELESKNIIRSRVVFETIVIFLGGEKYIAPGDYLFESKISVFKVAGRVVKGERHLAPVKVTIPEGFNVSDISNIFLKKLANFNESKFLAEAIKKEGYLFPDTYFFFSTDNEQDVIYALSDNFEEKISSIRSSITLSGKTEKEIITMASIIEKESKGDIDRKIISGILWKRINMGMPLQVDADLSTYKTKGLPKNPICNPGMESIKAAISPEQSSYLYYLHDKDGNVHYAKTFAEHKINKLKYLKN